MKRFSRSAAVLAALLGVQHAWALGLGEATVSSDMSSALRMTVPLVGVGGAGVDPDSLRVDVPGELEQEVLGFPDPIRPADLRVQLSDDGSGGARIAVTTRAPTREPVLRFLIRVVWPGGQRLRQYELIIDPPAVVRPVRRGGSLPVIVQARPTAAPAAAPALAAPRPAVPPRAGSRYGPVAAGDTLNAIALAAYPERASGLDSVMQAVVDRNPGAFVEADPDRLMMGAFLDLPDAANLLAAGPAGAVQPARAPAIDTLAAGEGEYLVAAGDTLYAIARQVAGPQDNLGAVVRALYDNNPQAFVDGDIDRLQAGAVVRLPRAGGAQALESSPPAPVVNDTAREEQVADLRSSLEATGAAVIAERTRQAELRERLDSLIAQMESLRVRDAELTAQSEALAAEVERRNVAAGAAPPAGVESTLPTPDTASAPAIPVDTIAAAPQAAVAEASPPPEQADQNSTTPVTTSAEVAEAPTPAGDNESASSDPVATPAVAPQAAVAEVAEAPQQAVAAPGVVVNPAVQDRPVLSRPARRRITGEPAPESGFMGFLGPFASGPLLWLAVGLFVVAVLVLVVVRRLRGGSAGRDVAPRQRADEEATAQRLAEVRERHTESGRFEAEALAAAEEEKRSTVHLTDTARAGNLAKEAAVHLAYEDYSAAKACITEAIRLDPHRDEHKMVLVTVYESTGEQDKARAIVDDLVARREQLPGDLRKQVEQLRQGEAG